MGYVSYQFVIPPGLGVLIKNGDRLGANGRVSKGHILVGISLDFIN
jgi:hypothetical protein